MAIAISAMTANSTPPGPPPPSRSTTRDGTLSTRMIATATKPRTRAPAAPMRPMMRWTTDWLSVSVGTSSQAEQVEPQAEPVEHHQPDEADADQQRVDVEVVGEAARDAAQDAVVAAAPKEAWGGGLFGRHARMIGRVAPMTIGEVPHRTLSRPVPISGLSPIVDGGEPCGNMRPWPRSTPVNGLPASSAAAATAGSPAWPAASAITSACSRTSCGSRSSSSSFAAGLRARRLRAGLAPRPARGPD